MVETKIADPSRLHYYYQEHIAEEEKKAYERILTGYHEMTKKVSLKGMHIVPDRLSAIHQMVLHDHPELFWTNGAYAYTSAESAVEDVYLEFTMDSVERTACQMELDKALLEYTRVLRGRMKDYEAVLKIYERMIDLLDYDSIALEQQERERTRGKRKREEPDHLRSVYGALVRRKAVCAGYAKGFQYILQNLGLECLSVTGPCKGKGAHQWNIVRLNGQYYHIDVTWGDGSNTDASRSRAGISYNYFCLTDREIKRSRSIDPLLPVPCCLATRCNYFRWKKLYMDKYDLKSLLSMIRTQVSKKKNKRIQIRFSTAALLKRAEKDLFTDQRIFKILEDAGINCSTVWHSQDPVMLVLTVWSKKSSSSISSISS